MEENRIVEFIIELKRDKRVYLAGSVDINTIDDDEPTVEYEQNDGTFDSHIPSYWKVDGEDLSIELNELLGFVDWSIVQQWLYDCRNESRVVDCGEYYLHINKY